MGVQKLTIANAIKAARKAHAEKRLGAQRKGVKKGERDCLYDYGDGVHRCGIGAGLTKATLAKIASENSNDYPVGRLARSGLIKTDNIQALSTLQYLHDGWAMSRDVHEALLLTGVDGSYNRVSAITKAHLVKKGYAFLDEAAFLCGLKFLERLTRKVT